MLEHFYTTLSSLLLLEDELQLSSITEVHNHPVPALLTAQSNSQEISALKLKKMLGREPALTTNELLCFSTSLSRMELIAILVVRCLKMGESTQKLVPVQSRLRGGTSEPLLKTQAKKASELTTWLGSSS